MKAKTHDFLKEIHNRFRGERLFVLATGPSLSKIPDINVLRDEFTFGVNRLMDWDGMTFEPTFYGACENIGLTDFILPSAAKAPHSTKFFAHDYDYTQQYDMPDWHWLYRLPLKHVWTHGPQGMGEDFDYVACGSSVVFDVAVQVGLWMGFKDIYLLGCDNQTDQHIYDDPDVQAKYPAHPVDIEKLKERQKRVALAAIKTQVCMETQGRRLIDCSDGALSLPKLTVKEALCA